MQPVTSVIPVNSPRDLPSPDAYDAHLASHAPASVAGFARSTTESPLASFLQDVFRTQDVRMHPSTCVINGQTLPLPAWMQSVQAHERKLQRDTRLSCVQARAILVAALERPIRMTPTGYPVWNDTDDDE